jgi:ankyrin repeat protein
MKKIELLSIPFQQGRVLTTNMTNNLFRCDWFQSILGSFLEAEDVASLVKMCGTWEHLLDDFYDNRKVFLASVGTNNIPLCRFVIPCVANISVQDGIILACKRGLLEMFRYLLDDNIPRSIYQLWMISSLHGHLELMKLLYERYGLFSTVTHETCVLNTIRSDRADAFFWLLTLYPSEDYYSRYFFMICRYEAFRILSRLDLSRIDEYELRYTFHRMCTDNLYRVLEYFQHNPNLSHPESDNGFMQACLRNHPGVVRHFLEHAPRYLSRTKLFVGYDIAVKYKSRECIRLIHEHIKKHLYDLKNCDCIL